MTLFPDHQADGGVALQSARRDDALAGELGIEAELQHRVRNTLSVIRSLFERTVAHGNDLETVATHFQGRLDAVARYQGILARGVRGTTDLETMIRDELQSFQFGDQAGISIAGPDVRLSGDAIVPLGLAIHELATNSVKFGALSSVDDRAHLSVEWDTLRDILTLQWKETGISVVRAAPVRRGFGRELIEQGLPYQIDAETTFTMLAGGVECTIAVPMKQFGRAIPPI